MKIARGPLSRPAAPCGPALRRCAVVLALGPAVMAAAAVPLTVKVTDTAGQPLKDAAVSVQVAGAPAHVAASTKAEMAQRARSFVPHVLVVQAGTAVSFPNYDKVHHHVYSFSPAKTFELKLYGDQAPPPVVFDKVGTVSLGCNIHDRMSGYIHVVDTPHFAVTGEPGTASLDVPAGDHRIHVWHPSMGTAQFSVQRSVHVAAGGGELVVALDTKR